MTTTDTIRCHRCGSTSHYTRPNSIHIEVACAGCHSHIKFVAKEKPYEEITIHLPKYAGQRVCEIEDAQYLHWVLTGFTGKIQPATREAVRRRLEELNYQTA